MEALKYFKRSFLLFAETSFKSKETKFLTRNRRKHLTNIVVDFIHAAAFWTKLTVLAQSFVLERSQSFRPKAS